MCYFSVMNKIVYYDCTGNSIKIGDIVFASYPKNGPFPDIKVASYPKLPKKVSSVISKIEKIYKGCIILENEVSLYFNNDTCLHFVKLKTGEHF